MAPGMAVADGIKYWCPGEGETLREHSSRKVERPAMEGEAGVQKNFGGVAREG